LTLFQIYARLITQELLLYAATEWMKNETAEEVLGIKRLLNSLDKINYVEYVFESKTIKLLPTISSKNQQIILDRILDRLNIKLPAKICKQETFIIKNLRYFNNHRAIGVLKISFI